MSTSQAPTLVKLPKVGDTLTMAVMSCALLKIGTYPEVEFVGLDGTKQLVAVRVPQKSADRQLQRSELPEYGNAVGKLLTFGRDPNPTHPSKPFWSISNEGEAPADYLALMQQPVAAAPAAASKPAAQPAAPAQGAANGNGNGDSSSAIYAKATKYVLDNILPMYAAKNIPVTMEGTAAIVATLFIEYNRRH